MSPETIVHHSQGNFTCHLGCPSSYSMFFPSLMSMPILSGGNCSYRASLFVFFSSGPFHSFKTFGLKKDVFLPLHSLMTVRCSSLTMAPIWIWSPLWLSKGTSWRDFSRTTQGESDSRLESLPQPHTPLKTHTYTSTILGQNISNH